MNTFETLENRCRVCALELSDLTSSIPIFGESSKGFFLQKKISKYLYFSVLEEDLLPKKICATCFLKIESIDKFAYSASKNQECFVSWLKNRNHNNDINQTTIEMSTNSDFSFSNITIKKEFNQMDKQQIVIQPHKTRNPRHVDHITLEQIINDQILKNPKLPASTTITKIDEPKKQRRPQTLNSENNISIVSYNLQIGQLIKDYELLKLILRALKWEEYDRKASYQELIERLRRSNVRDILTNKNLLSDNDVVQLLRSYVNDSMFQVVSSPPSTPHHNITKIFQPQPVLLVTSPSNQTKANESAIQNVKQNESITSSETMEVSVDPGMYLDEESIIIEDDEETVSAAEAKIETAKLINEQKEPEPVEVKTIPFVDEQLESKKIQNDGKYVCTSCPETFSSNTDLQNHITTHLISSTSSTKISDSAIKKPSKKKKLKEDKLKSKRKKIIIRINPSPSKRSIRERAKVLQAKFCCAICKKSLSSKRNLDLHQETHKESNGKFRCNGENCKKLFGKLENFLKHREIHVKPVRRKKNQNEK